MPNMTNYRWRKTTDINREFALFELLSGDSPILCAGFSDSGNFELDFYEAIKGVNIEWDKFCELIEAGRRAADSDRS